MGRTAIQLLIRSGIVPRETLGQLVRWQLLPEEALGSSVDSSRTWEREWSRPERFVEEIARAVHDDERLRETELDVAGAYRRVWIRWRGGRFDREGREVIVDRFGRIFLPGRFAQRDIIGISLTGRHEDIQHVSSFERRYKGDEVSALVCLLEDEVKADE